MPTANYKTIFRADYKPDLGFYDKLFQVASELPNYKDWITTGLAVTLQNFEDRCSFSLALNFFAYVRDMKPQDDQKFDGDRIKEIVDRVPARLKLTQFQRLGLRCWFLCPVKMKFEELVFVANEKFLLRTKDIKDAISPSPTDVSYAVHFNEGKLKVVLRAGPMRREEVEAQFLPDRNTNFAVKERALPSEEFFGDLPEVGLLIDIDASQNDVEAGDLGKFLADAHALQAKLSDNIVKYVLGLAAKRK